MTGDQPPCPGARLRQNSAHCDQQRDVLEGNAGQVIPSIARDLAGD